MNSNLTYRLYRGQWPIQWRGTSTPTLKQIDFGFYTQLDVTICLYLFIYFIRFCIVIIQTINIESPHLTGVRCTSPDSACEGEKAIDLLALFTGSDIVKYQKAVWELMMNESNFLNEWFEDWKGVNSSYEESDYD